MVNNTVFCYIDTDIVWLAAGTDVYNLSNVPLPHRFYLACHNLLWTCRSHRLVKMAPIVILPRRIWPKQAANEGTNVIVHSIIIIGILF